MRFSALDGVVIVVGLVASAGLWGTLPEMSILIGFTLGHFFLFCNVFRVRRNPELVWTVIFLCVAGLGRIGGILSWPTVCLIQLPVTVILLWRETRMPCYHGILCRRWNARDIDAYLGGDFHKAPIANPRVEP